MSGLYQEAILDHYRNPRNFGVLKKSSQSRTINNPLCGDTITMQIVVRGNTVKEIAFLGEGCAISIASASILTEYVKGKSKNELLTLDKIAMMKLVGIEVGPTRIKCLLLPLEALHTILVSYET